MMEKYKDIRKDIPIEFNELKLIKFEKKRIKCINNGLVIPPLEILIHPTAKCNLKCSWCIGQNISEDKNDPINNVLTEDNNLDRLIESIINYKKYVVLDEKKELFSVKRVSFSGITGDPMVAQHVLLPAIEKLHEAGIQVGMFTNGLLINKKNVNLLTKMNYILISLDAGTPLTYDRMKNNGKKSNLFDKVLENIFLLNETKKKLNRGIEINVGYVLNEYNYMELFDVSKILKSYGVSNLRIKTDISSKLKISPEFKTEIENQYNLINMNLVDANFKFVQLHRIFVESDKKRYFNKCIINKLFANVSSDGFVYACNYHPAIHGVTYGNVKEETFETIWEKAQKNFDLSKCPVVCDPFKNRANNLLNSYFNDDEYRKDVDDYVENQL